VFPDALREERHVRAEVVFVNDASMPKTSMVANVNAEMPLLLFPKNTINTYGAERTTGRLERGRLLRPEIPPAVANTIQRICGAL